MALIPWHHVIADMHKQSFILSSWMWEQRRLSTYLIICPFLLDHFTPLSMLGQSSAGHLNPPALFPVPPLFTILFSVFCSMPR